MGKSSAPKPTDPRETSAATTGTNVATAVANSYLGNVNQVTPNGNLTYDQTGSYSWTDPYTHQTYDIPTFTATQTLTPTGEATNEQNQQAQLNLATLANSQSGFLNSYMSTPFSYDDNAHTAWANKLYNDINGQNIADNTEALRSQLANQGIKVGSDAYNKAMTGLQTSQQNAQNKFLLDSQNQGFSQAQASRNQPINEITALLSGSQVSQPTLTNTNSSQISGTDNGSIIANYDNQAMNAWQQNQSALGSTLGGVGGLFSGLGRAGFSFSDERLKTDARKVGETDDGIGIYAYRFKGNDKMQLGMMAQEVRKKRPNAVAELPNGVLMVNYEEATR